VVWEGYPLKKRLFLGAYWESVWTRGTSRNLRVVAEDRKRKTWVAWQPSEEGEWKTGRHDSAKSPGCSSSQV
jgi:hypothetical protein